MCLLALMLKLQRQFCTVDFLFMAKRHAKNTYDRAFNPSRSTIIDAKKRPVIKPEICLTQMMKCKHTEPPNFPFEIDMPMEIASLVNSYLELCHIITSFHVLCLLWDVLLLREALIEINIMLLTSMSNLNILM